MPASPAPTEEKLSKAALDAQAKKASWRMSLFSKKGVEPAAAAEAATAAVEGDGTVVAEEATATTPAAPNDSPAVDGDETADDASDPLFKAGALDKRGEAGTRGGWCRAQTSQIRSHAHCCDAVPHCTRPTHTHTPPHHTRTLIQAQRSGSPGGSC